MRGNSRRLVYVLFLVIFLLLGTRLLTGRSLLIAPESDAPVIANDRGVNSKIAPAYAPGIYMAGRRPKNSSYCSWNYDLPGSLRYSPSQIVLTPEAGDKGPYRVLPHIINGNKTPENHEKLVKVTLCTHATADQVYNVVELVRRWEGAVSLAVFAPGLDAGLAVDLIERACRCEPEMFKVSVHMIFPAGRPPAMIKNNRPDGDCAASDLLQWSDDVTDRKKFGMIYPINVGRNVARNMANSLRVLVSDIELLPSDKLASGFINMIHDRPPRTGLVFVVPVFEIEENEVPPKNKKQLIDYVKNGAAVYFHKYICTHCQRFPGISKWMLRPDPGRVRPLIVTRREYPHHRWEPVFIGTREDPLYNEDLSWEGRQDKMAQMLEMCLMNYRLIILDGAFLVHSPGIKRKTIKQMKKSKNLNFERTQEKRNAHLYQSITRELLKQYPTNRKCRQ